MTKGARLHVIVDAVDEKHFDYIAAEWDPYKIAIFVSAEQEDVHRTEYERIYWRFRDQITLYAGDVQMLISAYRLNNMTDQISHVDELSR